MGEKPTVLVVDDDPGIRDTMVDVLSLEGYTVDVAASGQQALDRVRARRYDVALLDIRMPEMNGLQTLRAIRALDSAVRVIMITGFEVGSEAEDAMSAGAEAVFRKPLDVASFLPVLLAASE